MVYAGGNEKVHYHFPMAKRAKASKKFKDNVVKVDGIENVKIGKKTRKDWFTIDLEKTKRVIAMNRNKDDKNLSEDELKNVNKESQVATHLRYVINIYRTYKLLISQINKSDVHLCRLLIID